MQQLLECVRRKGSDIVVSGSFLKSLKDIDLNLDGIGCYDNKSGLENVVVGFAGNRWWVVIRDGFNALSKLCR